jgi:hypothetical protein
VIENFGEGLHYGVRTIVRGEHKLNVCRTTPIELFNLREDPGEWDNIAGRPENAALVAELQAALDTASPEPERYDELRWQSEERRLAILGAIPPDEQPMWRGDWREEYRETYGHAPVVGGVNGAAVAERSRQPNRKRQQEHKGTAAANEEERSSSPRG